MHCVTERLLYPVTISLQPGLQAIVASTCDQVIYDDIFRDREYEPAVDHMIDLWHHRQPYNNLGPFNIVDLGMNLGYFSLYAANRIIERVDTIKTFHIIGAEAVPELAQECRRRLNGMWISEAISIHAGLVGKRSGNAGLEMSLSHPANRIARGDREIAPDTTNIRLLRYRDLLSIPQFPERIDLLKCDIEGAEEEFLESYPEVLERSDAIVIELHEALCNTRHCIEILTAAGFNRRELNRKQDTRLELYTRC